MPITPQPVIVRFKANGARDPKSIWLRDRITGQAYDFSGCRLIARYGRERAPGDLDPLGTFDSDDDQILHEVVTLADNRTANKITFDPEPESLLDLSSGRYPFDFLTDDGQDTDNILEGFFVIEGGAVATES